MDLGELERDEKLYRASRELLLDFKASLVPFLYATSRSGKMQIRRRVRLKDADRLVGLLEPHQDEPQLLDPHLNDFVPILRDAFIACLRAKPRADVPLDEKFLVPLSRAICKLLYTFCKIRGEKVILQFLSTDTAHIELLLSALEKESIDTKVDDLVETDSDRRDAWDWEEQYVTLLWLSLLILNPFDLDSISSGGTVIPAEMLYGLTLPPSVSGIPLRAIPLAIRYLVAPGKTSDAAKRLLVRVAMRKDMQISGVSRALIQWAISCLREVSKEPKSDHYYIGILSFLAGILRASEDSTDMDSYLLEIYGIFQGPSATKLLATSLARKISIKVQRSVCSLVLRNPDIQDSDVMLDGIIGFLLDTLSDASTPVRLASSKALSVLTSKMPPSMAAEVIEEVLAALKKDVIVKDSRVERYDLSGVNPSEWHGLILALSHLVYRRSPPASMLSSVISALLLGLSFEKRSPSGSSIGTNVRDAACFGIWALPRRYTTEEIQAVTIGSPYPDDDEQSSTIQSIATELVISASLDPERNIRRGCSAALQELIGRHPDTIAEGLTLVQMVDYHAVPLRSNAILHVSLKAAKLAMPYWVGISHGLLSWRGVGDPDASTRRLAAAAFGNVFWSSQGEFDEPWSRLPGVIHDIGLRLQNLKVREVDERHGLLLCFASVIDRMKYQIVDDSVISQSIAGIITLVVEIQKNAETTTYRRLDLIAEASCQLINACCHILRSEHLHLPDTDATREVTSSIVGSAISSSPSLSTTLIDTQNSELFSLATTLLSKWLQRGEAEVIEPASDAAVNLLCLLSSEQQQNMISDLISIISKSQRGHDKGVLIVLLVAYPIADSLQPAIIEAVRGYWNRGSDIESHVVVLQSIAKSAFASRTDFADIISEGLDDYTTNARGDVGSLVRIEAVKVARALWKDRVGPWESSESAIFSPLFGKVLRLGAEKLDRVRIEAQKSIGWLVHPSNRGMKPIQDLPPSSIDYFSFLLNMKTYGRMITGEYSDQWFLDTFEGYVTSADAGSEDLIRASRAALAGYCHSGRAQLEHVCETLFRVAKRNMKNDRVLVPALGAMAFLFDVRIMQESSTNWGDLYRLVQNAHYKTGNIRKLEASVSLYGGLVEVYPPALDKLTKMLLHPIPTLRNKVADTLFTVTGVGKGVNWSRAKKDDLERLREGLHIPVSAIG